MVGLVVNARALKKGGTRETNENSYWNKVFFIGDCKQLVRKNWSLRLLGLILMIFGLEGIEPTLLEWKSRVLTVRR